MYEGKRSIPINHAGRRDDAGAGAAEPSPDEFLPEEVLGDVAAGIGDNPIGPETDEGDAHEGVRTAAADPGFSDAEALDVVQGLVAQRDEYLDGMRRLKAEFDNFRKRSQRDVLEAGTRARLAVILELLPVLDNLERALSAAEHHEEGKVLEGVRLTHSLFADLLKKEGVIDVDPLGEDFDPNQHEAVMSQPADEPEGTVTAVFQRGYTCGDRLLRPAKVIVSAGPSRGSGKD